MDELIIHLYATKARHHAGVNKVPFVAIKYRGRNSTGALIGEENFALFSKKILILPKGGSKMA